MKNLPAKSFDVVFLDPMYPLKKKSKALVKKDMLMVRRLVGTDSDTYLLIIYYGQYFIQ
jgi:16S rRNA (guanine1516-N2)-methyltransferase